MMKNEQFGNMGSRISYCFHFVSYQLSPLGDHQASSVVHCEMGCRCFPAGRQGVTASLLPALQCFSLMLTCYNPLDGR